MGSNLGIIKAQEGKTLKLICPSCACKIVVTSELDVYKAQENPSDQFTDEEETPEGGTPEGGTPEEETPEEETTDPDPEPTPKGGGFFSSLLFGE